MNTFVTIYKMPLTFLKLLRAGGRKAEQNRERKLSPLDRLHMD